MSAPKDQHLAHLLKEAGLLSADQLAHALEEQRRSGDRLWDILKRDVSKQSLIDLFRMEIPLPFGRARQDELKDVLLEERIISDGELAEALQEEGEGGGDLGQLLVQRELLSEADLKRTYKERQSTGLPLWRTLINLNLISPAVLTDLMRRRLGRPADCTQEDMAIEILVNLGLIDPKHLEEAEEALGKTCESRIGYLIEEGHLTADMVAKATGPHLDIPLVRLKDAQIDPNVVYSLPEGLVRAEGVLPLKREDRDLTVAMLNPLAPGLVDRISSMTGCKIHPVLTTRKDLDQQIEHYFEKLTPPPEMSVASAAPAAGPAIPAVQLATTIIEGAIAGRATDIHLEPQVPETRVRYRIDGVLYDVSTIPSSMEASVFSRIKILSGMDITERRRPQDGHFTMNLGGREINMRVATVATHLGEKMVLRILDEANVLKGIRQLGLEEDDEARLRDLIVRPYGMLLVTGPIGSGKTTSLYASINEMNILESNIVTIEDPVEYRLPGVNQIQVNYSMDLDFPTLLRAVLRQDPDTLMVGEIRDTETAHVASWAGLTGQLVLATLHTNDAVSAVSMMMNLGAPRFVLAESLVGVVGQRLVRKICMECRVEYQPPASIIKALGLDGSPDKHILYRGAGCSTCQQTGYLGRTGIFEILPMTEKLKALILKEVPDDQIQQAAVQDGMRTLWDNGLRKVLAGVTTSDEFLREISR